MKNPFDPYGRNRRTPEGEPLEGYPGSGLGALKIIIPIIIGVIIVAFFVLNSVKIVDAGYRGVLLHFGAVDQDISLQEGLHFVVPIRDNVVQLEVRTQKIVVDALSASRDLQDVSTQVALNYHLDPNNVQNLYRLLGFDYANRVITPAIQESVKQVTARFDAEELITNRETVKNEIMEQIQDRLATYNIIVETISITEFSFSEQFVRAVEAKVEAQQRALQAQNELRRIQIEAQQNEARAIGEQKAAIARAEGVRQSNILQAQGEAEAITIIDTQLLNSSRYLEWLKSQKWDGQLPLVLGGGGATPFIEIPTNDREEQGSANTTAPTAAPTPIPASAAVQ